MITVLGYIGLTILFLVIMGCLLAGYLVWIYAVETIGENLGWSQTTQKIAVIAPLLIVGASVLAFAVMTSQS